VDGWQLTAQEFFKP